MSRPARVLVAVWPDWPVLAAGCRPDVPAAVVAANRVVAVTEAARAEGVERGLRRREAQGRCPGLEVVAADAGRDARAWEPVVAAVEELTTAVEVLGPGALCFATRGPSRYFGGDAALAVKVREVAGAAGVAGSGAAGAGAGGAGAGGAGAGGAGAGAGAGGAGAASAGAGSGWCRVGVADGRFAAGLAARVAPPEGLVIPPGESAPWLAPQPVRALGPVYEELADLLVRLGISRLGDLAALPAGAVLGRFGPQGVEARRLALGLDDQALQGREPPPDLSCVAEMDPPEQRVEAAAFVAKSLADQLHARLEEAGLATTMVAIEVETEHGESLVRHWRHEGALTAVALAERARWQLDGWLSGSVAGAGAGASYVGASCAGAPTAGITLLRLTPLEVRPDAGRQLRFWGGTADSDARAARAMARVQGLLGPEAVVTAVLGGGRGFADQVRLVPWGDARDGGAGAAATGPPGIGTAATGSAGTGSARSFGIGSSGTGAARPPVVRRRRASGAREAADRPAPWPGRLAQPSPAIVHQPPRTADICDHQGRPVEVSGRGLINTAPAALAVEGGPFVEIVQWAGPWPLEERWWELDGRRRARLQVVLADGEAHVVYREAGGWWLEASYG